MLHVELRADDNVLWLLWVFIWKMYFDSVSGDEAFVEEQPIQVRHS